MVGDRIVEVKKIVVILEVKQKLLEINGEIRQDGATDMMIFSLPQVIAHISEFTWLEPGDMIATGSPGGSATESDPPKWLKPGQQIEVEIGPIGVLRNPIEMEPS